MSEGVVYDLVMESEGPGMDHLTSVSLSAKWGKVSSTLPVLKYCFKGRLGQGVKWLEKL